MDLEETSEQIDGDTIVSYWHTRILFTLAYETPESVPLLRGKLRALNEVAGGSVSAVTSSVQSEISAWRARLTEYIQTPQEANQWFRVTAYLDPEGRLLRNSVQLAVQDADDSYIEVGKWLARIPTADRVETDGYVSMKAELTSISPMGPLPTDKYNRTYAVHYAESWVRNTTILCDTQPDTTTVQDSSNYNSAYPWWQCNDCSNFVSQCFYYAGIPGDTTWAPPPSKDQALPAWSTVSICATI